MKHQFCFILFQCWASVKRAHPALNNTCSICRDRCITSSVGQLASRYCKPMMFQCCPIAATLAQPSTSIGNSSRSLHHQLCRAARGTILVYAVTRTPPRLSPPLVRTTSPAFRFRVSGSAVRVLIDSSIADRLHAPITERDREKNL